MDPVEHFPATFRHVTITSPCSLLREMQIPPLLDFPKRHLIPQNLICPKKHKLYVRFGLKLFEAATNTQTNGCIINNVHTFVNIKL